MANWLRNSRGGIIVALAAISAYLLTLSRSIFLNDSAEFITAGATLGIPHPPGFPLYVILAKVFSWIPINTIAFRVNLLSAVAATAALILVYALLKKVLRELFYNLTLAQIEFFSIAGALTLAFTPTFWSQAITAESYALNVFFLVLLLYLFFNYLESGLLKWLWWAGAAAGFGIANHPMLALFCPVFFLAFLLPKPRSKKVIFVAILITVAITGAFYLFLPLRSSMSPALDWGQTSEDLRHFVAHVMRTQYQDVGFSASFSDRGQYFVAFFYDWLRELSALFLLALTGFVVVIRKIYKKIAEEKLTKVKLWSFTFFWVTAAIFIINTVGIILLRDTEFTFDNRYYYSTYYAPAYLISALWITLGFSAVLEKLQAKTVLSKKKLSIFFLIILAAPTFLFAVNFKNHNLRNFTFIEDFSRDLLQSLETNAVLVLSTEGTASDPLTFSLLYQKVVKKLRPDVLIVGYVDIFPTDDRKVINDIYTNKDLSQERKELIDYTAARQDFSDRPVYTTFIVDTLPAQQDYFSLSNGFVYKLTTDPSEELQESGFKIELSASDEEILRNDYAGLDFLGYYYLVSAAREAGINNRETSQALYIEAINADRDITGLDIEAYRTLRERELNN